MDCLRSSRTKPSAMARMVTPSASTVTVLPDPLEPPELPAPLTLAMPTRPLSSLPWRLKRKPSLDRSEIRARRLEKNEEASLNTCSAERCVCTCCCICVGMVPGTARAAGSHSAAPTDVPSTTPKPLKVPKADRRLPGP